jgi:hypothetical protein
LEGVNNIPNTKYLVYIIKKSIYIEWQIKI